MQSSFTELLNKAEIGVRAPVPLFRPGISPLWHSKLRWLWTCAPWQLCVSSFAWWVFITTLVKFYPFCIIQQSILRGFSTKQWWFTRLCCLFFLEKNKQTTNLPSHCLLCPLSFTCKVGRAPRSCSVRQLVVFLVQACTVLRRKRGISNVYVLGQ